LGVQGGYSQSYPYNKNQTNLEGGVKRVWSLPFNVNEGEPVDIVPGEQEASDADIDSYIQELLGEMGDNVPEANPNNALVAEGNYGINPAVKTEIKEEQL